MPEHLYVPTPPLWIESKGFKGPLDLLWYLIRKQNIDIMDIPVGLIAAQYVQYLKMMTSYRFEIAPDYLVMAVRLLQIKSQLMLPQTKSEESDEEDPRAMLVRQLVDYELIEHAAIFLNHLPRWNRDVWLVQIKLNGDLPPQALPDLGLNELFKSYNKLIKNKKLQKEHVVARPRLTLSERIEEIFQQLPMASPADFVTILPKTAENLDVAISFQAVLELAKNQQIEVEQQSWEDVLWLRRISHGA